MDVQTNTETPAAPRRSPWRIVLLVAALLGAIAAFRLLPLQDWLEAAREAAAAMGPWGPPAYVVVYALLTALAAPVVLLSVSSAAVFGFPTALVATIIGSNLGASLAFLLGRTVLRERVAEWARRHPRFTALDEALSAQGFVLVLLLRLSPVVPFSISNYLFGLTGVRWPAYALATLLGMLPGNVAFVYLGHVALSGEGQPGFLKILGAVATVAATIFIGRIAARALAKAGRRPGNDEAS